MSRRTFHPKKWDKARKVGTHIEITSTFAHIQWLEPLQTMVCECGGKVFINCKHLLELERMDTGGRAVEIVRDKAQAFIDAHGQCEFEKALTA